MQRMPPPQMFFNYPNTPGYPEPRGHLLAPVDPYYFTTAQPQHFYTGGNFPSGSVYASGYRPQIHSAPPPRPYLTITQFNYQPIGYHHGQTQPSAATNLVFGPPPRDRRVGAETTCRSIPGSTQIETEITPSPSRVVEKRRILCQRTSSMVKEECKPKQSTLKSDSSDSFEYTIPPEQIVKSVCEDNEIDCIQCDNDEPEKMNDEITNDVYCSPRAWPNCEIMDPMRIEDDDLTKFIVDGCLKAEAIAVRNQHRPCFKNIKHLCTRTRTDILKPRTTVANIHSQGIPWATKDFIFAFVRLINCWYILKGYLDDHEGTLGKIETALIPEFKECYQRWQSINKDMVKHLINIFVNLDNGITVQNAEIFSSFNSHKNVSPADGPLSYNNHNGKPTTSKSCPTKISIQEQIYQNKKIKNQTLIDLQSEQKTYNVAYSNNTDSCIDEKLKCYYLEGKSVPGILRVKDMFNHQQTIEESIEENVHGDNVCAKHHNIYMKPGSYRVPKKKFPSPTQSPRIEESQEQNLNSYSLNAEQSSKVFSNYHSAPDPTSDLWKNALESFGPFMETFLKESETASNSIINELSSYLNSNSNASFSSYGSNAADKSTAESKTSKNKETQAWVNEHDFSYYNEEIIEEVPTSQQQQQQFLQQQQLHQQQKLQKQQQKLQQQQQLQQKQLLQQQQQLQQQQLQQKEQLQQQLQQQQLQQQQLQQQQLQQQQLQQQQLQQQQQQQQQQQKAKLPKYEKNSTKKFPVTSRTYRKRTDDTAAEYPKPTKAKNSREFANPRKVEGNQTQTVNSMCFSSRRNVGLAPSTTEKFEQIINALWNLQFARYITFEVNAEHVPEYYKYITKPMFLYKIMNKLKQNKYTHAFQVVHDLRTIVRNSEYYVEKRPDWWFEKCLGTFSKELESQLAEKFSTLDFSSVTGDPMQPPTTDLNIYMKANTDMN